MYMWWVGKEGTIPWWRALTKHSQDGSLTTIKLKGSVPTQLLYQISKQRKHSVKSYQTLAINKKGYILRGISCTFVT